MKIEVSMHWLSASKDRRTSDYVDQLRDGAMKLLERFVPDADWLLSIDGQECAVVADLSEEAFEAFKADEHSRLEDQDWWLEIKIGVEGGDVWAKVSDYDYYKPTLIEDRTAHGILTAVAKTGWLGNVAQRLTDGQ